MTQGRTGSINCAIDYQAGKKAREKYYRVYVGCMGQSVRDDEQRSSIAGNECISLVTNYKIFLCKSKRG